MLLGCVGKSRRLWGWVEEANESSLSSEYSSAHPQNYAVVPNATDN